MKLTKKILTLFAAALFFSPFAVNAAATAPPANGSEYNVFLICMVTLIIVLLAVIGGLAYVLNSLSFTLRNKMRRERLANNNSGAVKALLLLLSCSIPAFHAFGAEKAVAAKASDMIQGIPAMDFYLIMFIIGLELVVIFIMTIAIQFLLRSLSNQPNMAPVGEVVKQRSWFWDKFNNAVELEKEKDILLDHNYDGIQELDNSLPPWWKYGFYLTIIVGCIYFYRFHISHDGKSPEEEYAVEMQKAADDKAAFLSTSANNIDENNVTLLTDAADLAAGKELFGKNCIACHLADGGGIVGPNLTDDYWLHGGSIKDIFKTIKNGWQDKGMKSWKDDFSPKQIQQLASYVKSLKGTHPLTPKAPQGELYIEAGASGATGSDSTKAKVDSTKVNKVEAAKVEVK